MEPVVETKFQTREESTDILKIVLVGDTQVGKTTLIQALTGTGIVERGYSVSLEISVSKKKSMKGRIYDLRSQRYFPYLHSLFYHGTMGAIIVFDVSNRDSFNSITKWRDIIWGHVGNIPLLLCGNKSDLRQKNEQQITLDEIQTLTNSLAIKQNVTIPYVEVSALKHIVAYSSLKENADDLLDIYPTLDAFRKPFVNWLIEIVKKGKATKTK